MNRKEFKEMIQHDCSRYKIGSHLKTYIMNPGYQITFLFRKCSYYRNNKLLKPLYYYYRWKYRSKCVKYGCDIPSHVQIGAGLKIDHPFGIVINSQAMIGENFNIKSGAVIGKNDKGVPRIGNNVTIGVNAVVIGNLTIEDDSIIGAGAIVVHNVPKSSVVVCEPAFVKYIR